VLDDRRRHLGIVLRSLEHPCPLGVHRIDDAGRRGHGKHWRLGFRDNVDHRQRIGRGRRADDHVHLVLGDQLARVLDRGSGVRGIVEDDIVDLLAGDGRRQERKRVLFGNAQRRRRTGSRKSDPDIDVGLRRCSTRGRQNSQNSGNG